LDGVGLQETIREDFTMRELSDLVGDVSFKWIWKETRRHSGGILMGIGVNIYDLEDFEVSDFYVNMVLRHRITNHVWELIVVYGPTQHEH
jgi:hypothetical protein